MSSNKRGEKTQPGEELTKVWNQRSNHKIGPVEKR